MIDETAEEIADMQTHSSSDVAVKAARALRELTGREFPTLDEYHRTLERNSNALRRANPSHASLHNSQRQIVEQVTGSDAETVEAAQSATDAAIDEMVETIDNAKRRAAERAADELSDGETILTHDYSTTVLSTIERALADDLELTVYVTEARPRFLGRRMARALAALDGVETTLTVDSASATVLPNVDRVLLGMTCIVDETLYNRVGTYPLAATANELSVPVSVVGSAAKIIEGGFVFENEYRAASEVMREPAEGFDIENPAYDGTPTRLLDSVVTDEGLTRY